VVGLGTQTKTEACVMVKKSVFWGRKKEGNAKKRGRPGSYPGDNRTGKSPKIYQKRVSGKNQGRGDFNQMGSQIAGRRESRRSTALELW